MISYRPWNHSWCECAAGLITGRIFGCIVVSSFESGENRGEGSAIAGAEGEGQYCMASQSDRPDSSQSPKVPKRVAHFAQHLGNSGKKEQGQDVYQGGGPCAAFQRV